MKHIIFSENHARIEGTGQPSRARRFPGRRGCRSLDLVQFRIPALAPVQYSTPAFVAPDALHRKRKVKSVTESSKATPSKSRKTFSVGPSGSQWLPFDQKGAVEVSKPIRYRSMSWPLRCVVGIEDRASVAHHSRSYRRR